MHRNKKINLFTFCRWFHYRRCHNNKSMSGSREELVNLDNAAVGYDFKYHYDIVAENEHKLALLAENFARKGINLMPLNRENIANLVELFCGMQERLFELEIALKTNKWHRHPTHKPHLFKPKDQRGILQEMIKAVESFKAKFTFNHKKIREFFNVSEMSKVDDALRVIGKEIEIALARFYELASAWDEKLEQMAKEKTEKKAGCWPF